MTTARGNSPHRERPSPGKRLAGGSRHEPSDIATPTGLDISGEEAHGPIWPEEDATGSETRQPSAGVQYQDSYPSLLDKWITLLATKAQYLIALILTIGSVFISVQPATELKPGVAGFFARSMCVLGSWGLFVVTVWLVAYLVDIIIRFARSRSA